MLSSSAFQLFDEIPQRDAFVNVFVVLYVVNEFGHPIFASNGCAFQFTSFMYYVYVYPT